MVCMYVARCASLSKRQVAYKSRQPWLKRSIRTKDEKRAKLLFKPVTIKFDRVIADAEALLAQQSAPVAYRDDDRLPRRVDRQQL